MQPRLAQYWQSIQRCLYPEFKEEIGSTTEKHLEIRIALDVLQLDNYFYEPPVQSFPGRPPVPRTVIAKAFVSKEIFNLPTTKSLIDKLKVDPVLRRICGLSNSKKIPSKGSSIYKS